MDYDLRALRLARRYAKTDDERLALLRRSCDVSARDCIPLGDELARLDRAYEAAASYERAFADPSLDHIVLSNMSRWLVDYYYRHGRTAAALDLAERASSTGAQAGLNTQAHLYELMGKWREAEGMYTSASAGYENPAALLGFYYRAVNVRKQALFEPEWKRMLARVFPSGLQAAPTGAAHPAIGVVVTQDSELSRKAGLQTDDIITGLEGWRVENLHQYYAINAFFETNDMKLTVWRGRTFTVEVTAPDRLMGISLRTYPIRGWSER